MRINAKGESKIGCLFAVLLLLLAIYVGFIGVPPYYNSVQYFDECEALVTRAAVYGWSEKKVTESLLDLARKLSQPVAVENIKVSKTRNNMMVEINYILPMDFGFYNYDLPRNARFSGLSGSLR